MILSSVDLPEPFSPSTPIFAPGKNDSEMSFRICRLGGTVLPTRFIVYTYCAIASSESVVVGGAIIAGRGHPATAAGRMADRAERLGRRGARNRRRHGARRRLPATSWSSCSWGAPPVLRH